VIKIYTYPEPTPTPGFAGAHAQVKQLEKLIRADWKRVRHSSEEMPEIPKHLGYVQRIADKGKLLSKLPPPA